MTVVFFSYSHADEDLRDKLKKNLTMLKRQGVIETFHDRRIRQGTRSIVPYRRNWSEPT